MSQKQKEGRYELINSAITSFPTISQTFLVINQESKTVK